MVSENGFIIFKDLIAAYLHCKMHALLQKSDDDAYAYKSFTSISIEIIRLLKKQLHASKQ